MALHDWNLPEQPPTKPGIYKTPENNSLSTWASMGYAIWTGQQWMMFCTEADGAENYSLEGRKSRHPMRYWRPLENSNDNIV